MTRPAPRSTGTTTSPRGVTTVGEKVPQPYRFAGGYQDPTGLYHLEARYLDPSTGRFTQPDPSGLEANPYLYASGDPTNMIDPSGLWGFSDFTETLGASIGAVLGAAATGAFCAVTAGGGCLVVAAVLVGLGSGSGGAIGSALGGGDAGDREDAFINGFMGGAAGGGAVSYGLGRYLR